MERRKLPRYNRLSEPAEWAIRMLKRPQTSRFHHETPNVDLPPEEVDDTGPDLFDLPPQLPGVNMAHNKRNEMDTSRAMGGLLPTSQTHVSGSFWTKPSLNRLFSCLGGGFLA